MTRRDAYIVATLLVLVVALGVGQARLDQKLVAQAQGVQAPLFEVDPLWPKPLPNHWVLGSAIGVTVDEQDHIWIVHRSSSTLANQERGRELTPPTGDCCAGAPPVLEFDQEGNLLRHWGGPGSGYEWPQSNHGLAIDGAGNLWIGGNGAGDSHVLVFTRDGKFLRQIGRAGARNISGAGQDPEYEPNSHDAESFGRVAKIFVDPQSSEAYISDGYLNKRVAVIDAGTGALKRYWGAYGNRPDDTNLGRYDPDAPPAQQFRNPVHCAELANDGLLYVCDRPNNRIQVFQKDGTFVKEAFIAKQSLGEGSVWDIAFSTDPEQRYIFLADGRNMKVRVLQRDTLQELTSFGDGGRQPGQFYAVHSIAVDSEGNLYTTETYEGKRLQKFVYKGIGAVTQKNQGVVWPATPSP